MAEEVQVFGYRSGSFSRRIELALKLKGVDYEHIEEDLLNNKKSDLLLKYNPIYKKVPVLVHNGNPISESVVILEYIEDTWKHNPIFPEHPYDRAQARFWAKYIDDMVVPAMQKASLSKEEEREKAIEELHKKFEPLENELKNKKFFGGDEMGVVDIVGFVFAGWIPAIEEAVGFKLLNHKFPNLRKWIEEYANHTVAKQVLPEKDALVVFIKNVSLKRKY
ncbi:putative glutathione S-transferase, partial [Cucurbita argyrosperma subsp. sororia]